MAKVLRKRVKAKKSTKEELELLDKSVNVTFVNEHLDMDNLCTL